MYLYIQRKLVALTAVLFGLVSLAVGTWSSVDYTLAQQIRSRSSRSLRADDCDLAHEHGFLPNASADSHAASAISEPLTGDDEDTPDSSPAALPAARATQFGSALASVAASPHTVFASVFSGAMHSLRGPPVLS